MSKRFLREEMLFGPAAMEILRRSSVIVFGLGGVGSWCAEGLARAGIGSLTLVDQDTADESNINRQLCALNSTLGTPKAEIMAARVCDINPEIDVRALVARYEAQSRERFFDRRYDYIVDCIDLVSCKVDLIETARRLDIPIISALGAGNKKNAEMLTVTDISKTAGDPLARVVRKELRKRGIEHLPVVFSGEQAIKPADAETPPPGRRSVPGSLVWVTASAGMLLCSHVVQALLADGTTREPAKGT